MDITSLHWFMVVTWWTRLMAFRNAGLIFFPLRRLVGGTQWSVDMLVQQLLFASSWLKAFDEFLYNKGLSTPVNLIQSLLQNFSNTTNAHVDNLPILWFYRKWKFDTLHQKLWPVQPLNVKQFHTTEVVWKGPVRLEVGRLHCVSQFFLGLQ